MMEADFSSAELKGALRGLLPDPDMMGDKDPPVTVISRLAHALTPDKWQRAFATLGAKVHGVYAGTDEFFKIAAFLKAKAQSMTSQQAADEVRKWFPYYDNIGSSGALKFIRRVHPFFSFFRESLRILGNAVRERPLSLSGSMIVPYVLTQISMAMLGLVDDRDQEEVLKDMKGKLKGTSATPVFSLLLPWRMEGRLAQFDMTNVSPFASLLSSHLDTTGDDLITTTAKQLLSGSPGLGILYSLAANEDPFNNRPITQPDMGTVERNLERGKHIAGALLPPLLPGGTSFSMLANAGERTTNKTLEKRNVAQAVLRGLLGLDIRNASPDLYRVADDYRKAANLPTDMWAGGTTAQQRMRQSLFTALVKADGNPQAANLRQIKELLSKLRESGKPVENQQDINRLLFYRDPAKIIDNKHRTAFMASLAPETQTLMQDSLAEFHRIQQTAPLIISQALASPE